MKRTTKLIFSACLCAGAVAGLLKAYADAVLSGEPSSKFETAVEIIKKYETLHQPRHWPFVGYGHRVLPGEKFPRNRALDEATADKILRKDLLKNCAVFRNYGADSLLLGVLAYNIGMGAVSRSSLTKRLAAGDRDIRDLYLSHSRYRGKPHARLRMRRAEEFDSLFVDNVFPSAIAVSSGTSDTPPPLTGLLPQLKPAEIPAPEIQ